MKDISIPNNVDKKWDDKAKQYYVEYKNASGVNKMWIEDEKSISDKIDIINKYGLCGVGFWELGRENPKVWNVVSNKIK